jgi:hypothetical protein
MTGISRGAGGSLSGLDDCGGVYAEGAVDRRESLPAATVAGSAAQTPAAAARRRGPAVLDYCQPMVQ